MRNSQGNLLFSFRPFCTSTWCAIPGKHVARTFRPAFRSSGVLEYKLYCDRGTVSESGVYRFSDSVYRYPEGVLAIKIIRTVDIWPGAAFGANYCWIGRLHRLSQPEARLSRVSPLFRYLPAGRTLTPIETIQDTSSRASAPSTHRPSSTGLPDRRSPLDTCRKRSAGPPRRVGPVAAARQASRRPT